MMGKISPVRTEIFPGRSPFFATLESIQEVWEPQGPLSRALFDIPRQMCYHPRMKIPALTALFFCLQTPAMSSDYDFASYFLSAFPEDLIEGPRFLRRVAEVIEEHRDFLELQKADRRTHPTFLPYLADYIEKKGRPLDYPIKIFFTYDEDRIWGDGRL